MGVEFFSCLNFFFFAKSDEMVVYTAGLHSGEWYV